jgi:4-amino-4-deoxy-L-arabinose transferase-like glycosyltransferase
VSLTPSEKLDRRIGWALFGLSFIALWATQAGVGIPRDESFYFLAAQNSAGWFRLLWNNASQALTDGAISQAFGYNSEHPVLMKNLFGLSYLFFHEDLGWLSAQAAFRIPAFAAAASIPMLSYWMGARLFGRVAGAFAAIAFLLVPRQFFNSHLACFDVPIAAAVLLLVYVFWRAQDTRWGWLWTGVAFGAAAAIKHNALFVPMVLAPMALYRAWRNSAAAPDSRRELERFFSLYAATAALLVLLALILSSGAGSSGKYGLFTRLVAVFEPISPPTALLVLLALGSGWILWRLHRIDETTFRPLACIAAMACVGPVLLYLLWPYLWHHPVARTADWLEFHASHVHYAWFYLGTLMREPPFPLEYVFAVTAMTVPTSLMVPMALGLLSVGGRAAAALFHRTRSLFALPSWDEALVAFNGLAPILLISAPSVPHFGGVKHWFTAMPFLALLAGAAVQRAAGLAHQQLAKRRPTLPAWAAPVGLCALLFAPALWATARIYRFGTSAYAEIVGGLPGAASLGMQRQFWSNNVTGVLPWINENAPRGARLWLHEVTDYSFLDYQREGLLRSDLRIAHGPGEADVAAYQYHQEFREQEFDIWQAFGTTHPSTGLYLDETPQVVVYRRP